MASVRGLLNIQSLNELTYENVPDCGTNVTCRHAAVRFLIYNRHK